MHSSTQSPSPSAPGEDAGLSRFNAWQPRFPLAVACSGGADSMALLELCAARWPGQVTAVHVNHGLQAAAAAFESCVREACERLGLPCLAVSVYGSHQAGQSPEDAARIARYRAIASCLSTHRHDGLPVRDVALAHHAHDQLEGLLVALSRGAGLPGLSGMAVRHERLGLCWHRPLLACSPDALRELLRRRDVRWCEDPMNADARYLRSRLRHELLPALAAVLPQLPQTALRSAAHVAQAQRLLAQLADEDLARVGVPPRIDALRTMDPDRQANALRRWLHETYATLPSTAQLGELQKQIGACTTRGHQLTLRVGRGQVTRKGACLHWEADATPSGSAWTALR